MQHTRDFLSRRFWWPRLDRDVREFVVACSVCARNKTSHLPSSGLLRPLPIPKHPWSHVALDFIMGLPGYRVPLPKLPSARETAQLMIQHLGAGSSHGQNMHTILCKMHPQVIHHLRLRWVINLRFFRNWRKTVRPRLLVVLFKDVERYGGRFGRHCCDPP